MKKALVCIAVVLMLSGLLALPARAALPTVPEEAVAISQISVRFLEGYDDAIEVSANVLEDPGYICPADAYGAPLPIDFYLEVKVERFDATKNKWFLVDLYLLNCGKTNLGSHIKREIYGINAQRYKYTFSYHANITGSVYAYDKEENIAAKLWDNTLAWTKHEPFVWCQNCDWKNFNDLKDPLSVREMTMTCHANSIYATLYLENVSPGDTIMLKGFATDNQGRVYKAFSCSVGGLSKISFRGLPPDSDFTIKVEATNFRKTVAIAKRASTIPLTEGACK
jgi:hypothetical protein